MWQSAAPGCGGVHFSQWSVLWKGKSGDASRCRCRSGSRGSCEWSSVSVTVRQVGRGWLLGGHYRLVRGRAMFINTPPPTSCQWPCLRGWAVGGRGGGGRRGGGRGHTARGKLPSSLRPDVDLALVESGTSARTLHANGGE